MKKVVIIGGGFAGALASKKLEKHTNIKIILIDTKDYFEFTPSVLRTIVAPEHAKMIEVRHKDYLKNTRVVIGEVKSVSERNVMVGLRKGSMKKIGFDYLIIASGSRYNSPIKEKNLVISSRKGILRDAYKKVCRAKNILIIGGGIVGTELAAEIATHHKNKNLTIVHSRPYLMERQNEKARKYAERYLMGKGVRVIFNERAMEKKGKYYVTDKGTKIKTDLAFLCTGIAPNFEFLQENFSSFLNEKNQIKVNGFLQVENHGNIFAAGDITSINEEKLAQNAEKQGRVAAKNIIRLISGKPLKEYQSNPRVMVISLGQWDGLLTYKDFSLGGIIPGIMKTIIEWKTMLRYKF